MSSVAINIVGSYIPAGPDGDFIENRNQFITLNGVILRFLHPRSACEGRGWCVIHEQSNHHMRGWELFFDFDRKAMYRVCPHGISHPDPDDAKYWEQEGEQYRLKHHCDGCCHG